MALDSKRRWFDLFTNAINDLTLKFQVTRKWREGVTPLESDLEDNH